jgi:hypothetical protein
VKLLRERDDAGCVDPVVVGYQDVDDGGFSSTQS